METASSGEQTTLLVVLPQMVSASISLFGTMQTTNRVY